MRLGQKTGEMAEGDEGEKNTSQSWGPKNEKAGNSSPAISMIVNENAQN